MFDFARLAAEPPAPAQAIPAENGIPPCPMAEEEPPPAQPAGVTAEHSELTPAAPVAAAEPWSTTARMARRLPTWPPAPAEQEAFRAGWSWLAPRLPELLSGGWRRPELFRRNKARRGLAWSPLWADQAITPSLAESGAVIFYISRPGRETTQTARPRSRCPGITIGGQPT
ncbi:MAG: hypothetical protein U5J62_06415 [Desulfurivibrio sp.]|nr:hypothetical protein [Desulfurivibrio sp.]